MCAFIFSPLDFSQIVCILSIMKYLVPVFPKNSIIKIEEKIKGENITYFPNTTHRMLNFPYKLNSTFKKEVELNI